MRGLKQTPKVIYRCKKKSHLLQMRGLKPFEKIYIGCSTVASFTDAWIETQKKVFDEMEKRSHLLQMRGLKQTHHCAL